MGQVALTRGHHGTVMQTHAPDLQQQRRLHTTSTRHAALHCKPGITLTGDAVIVKHHLARWRQRGGMWNGQPALVH